MLEGGERGFDSWQTAPNTLNSGLVYKPVDASRSWCQPSCLQLLTDSGFALCIQGTILSHGCCQQLFRLVASEQNPAKAEAVFCVWVPTRLLRWCCGIKATSHHVTVCSLCCRLLAKKLSWCACGCVIGTMSIDHVFCCVSCPCFYMRGWHQCPFPCTAPMQYTLQYALQELIT